VACEYLPGVAKNRNFFSVFSGLDWNFNAKFYTLNVVITYVVHCPKVISIAELPR